MGRQPNKTDVLKVSTLRCSPFVFFGNKGEALSYLDLVVKPTPPKGVPVISVSLPSPLVSLGPGFDPPEGCRMYRGGVVSMKVKSGFSMVDTVASNRPRCAAPSAPERRPAWG